MQSLRYLLTVALLLSACGLVWSQTTQPAGSVALVTMGPGEAIFEQFSHNAIRVHDASQPPPYDDVAFNYGLFSFGGDFIWRFAFGHMRYWMGGEQYPAMVQGYRDDNRDLWLQTLNFAETQRQRLAQFLWDNSVPENRYYTYNYFTDNCSTRVRDALDRALNGAIKAQTADIITGRTYRFHARRILIANPIIYIAVDFVMGPSTDRDLSRWEEMFLPQLLRQYLRDVHVKTAGGEQPLVLEETNLFSGTRPAVRDRPPQLTWVFATVGLLMAAALLALQRYRRKLIARITRNTIIIAWALLSTIAGLCLMFFMVATDHWATYRNENILQMPPIALATLILLPWALRMSSGRPKYPLATRAAAGLAILTAACSALGLAIKCLPMFRQQNWDFIVWLLPVHIAVAIILCQAAWREATGGAIRKG